MRKLGLGVLFLLISAPLARAELVWNGGAGVRHVIQKFDDGLGTTTAVSATDRKDTSKTTRRKWEYRGALGVSAKGDEVDWGFDVRTQSSATSEWLTNSNNTDLTIGLSQAYARFRKNFLETDVAVTVGRAKTVILYDNLAQALFDNDNRFDGFGWAIKHGMFGLNMTQYVLGATNRGTGAQASTYSYTEASELVGQTQSHFGYLFSFQPWVQFKLGEDITSLFAVGYHNWSGTGGSETSGWYSNAIHGGTAGAAGDVTSVSMDDAKQWQFLSDTSLPYSLRFVGEFIINKKSFYGSRLNLPNKFPADRHAWALSLYYGKPKKAGEFGLGYSYSNKGIASVNTTFTNGDAPADNISHFFEAKYFVADAVSLTGKAQFHREKALLDGKGGPMTGVDANRKQTQQRFELVTAIQL